MAKQTITTTDFHFPGQTKVYHGKVRDVYFINDTYLASVATDRISAFDVILSRAIPYKGQVLNQLASHLLSKTADVVPNWLLRTPDPNVSVGLKAEPIKIEMVVRGCLVGSAWRAYSAGERIISGVTMPDGLQEYDYFPEPLITPSTKADSGHDEDISATEIIKQGLVTAEEWEVLCDYTLKLFARGQSMAMERGLILADTKYEFGKLNSQIILIDEVHTPDSSRYFYADSFASYLEGRKGEHPKHLSKEFLREWLLEQGFSGQAGKAVPEMSDDFVAAISERYIELYEQLTGKAFEKADNTNVLKRIETNTKKALEQLT